MTDKTQPEALDLADWLEAVGGYPPLPRPDLYDSAAGTVGWSDGAMQGFVDADRAARSPADSVLEDAETALRKVLGVVQRYLPPDGPSAHDSLSAIIEIVDPWPLGPLEKP